MNYANIVGLGEFGVPEAETDAKSLGFVEKRLRFRARHRALVIRVKLGCVTRDVRCVSLIEVPAREERRQRQLWKDHQVAAGRCALLK